MTDLLPETRAFLRDWLDWVERGAPEDEPYGRYEGLCSAATTYQGRGRVERDLSLAFGSGYPFGRDNFWDRWKSNTQHECPKRLAWAREHAAEKSLSHSEGEEK